MPRTLTDHAAKQACRLFLTPLLVAIVFLPARLSGQTCGCSNCPQDIPDQSTTNFLIQVNNATNPTLGQNGQGVCGVVLHFEHDYLSDLSITLTNPAGKSVTLVGPTGFYDATTFTSWNVTFLPCAETPNPDAGFSPKWSNQQPWGSFGTFSGSYYPYAGCLESLNNGPVNGTWTLTVTDVLEDDLGFFADYQIIFCDPAGINCFNCLADAGNLLQPDLTVCADADTLRHLGLPPTYPIGTTSPPTAQYSYRYVLSGAGGVILAYLDTLNLSQHPPGDYTLCGLSFLTTQLTKLPLPNNSLTVQQLTAQLNSSAPPFCGDLSTNCVNVRIKAVPPNTMDTVVVCYPECYTFGGQARCDEGIYSDTLQQNGCDYIATIRLLIQYPDTTMRREVICTGQCSATPGFEQYCTAGTYTRLFQTTAGCDSTVILDLQVMTVQAAILPPDTLQCNKPTVPLLGTGSSSGPDISYHWTAKSGGLLAGPDDQINATAAQPGSYQLRVCRTDSSGASCCDSLSILVRKRNVAPPGPGLISGLPVLCLGQTATYTIAPVPGASTYNWLLPPGATLISGQGDTSIVIQWDSPMAAALCVTAADSCGNLSTPRCRVIQTGQVAPPVQTPLGDAQTCRDSVSTYHIPPFTGATDYLWVVDAPHTLLSGQGSPEVSIRWGDAPTAKVCVQVTNSCGTSQPGCTDITVLSLPPTPILLGDTTACQTDTATYSIGNSGAQYQYTWTVTGGQILSGQNSPQIKVHWDTPLGFGTVCVEAGNTCGTSPTRCMAVRSGLPPALGAVSRLCDSTDLSHYQVRFQVIGGTAPFTVAGGIVNNGVFLSDPILNSTAYSFILTDAYGCASAEVKGKYNCNCISNAGTLASQLLKICEGGQATITASSEKTDPNDLSIFILHSDSSAVFTSALAQNSTGVFGFQANMSYSTRYYVTHLVGDPLNGLPDPDDPCYSISNTQPLVFLKNPVAIGGDDQAVCGKTLSLAATGIGTWLMDQQPANSSPLLTDPQSASSSLSTDSAGTYQLIWRVLDANGCVGQDEVNATFHPLPVLAGLTRTCDAANLNYVVVITLAGGTPPYNVGGNFIAGNVFTSPSLANGQPFSYSLGDTLGCTLSPAMGLYDCSCTSDAGTMSAQLLEACSDSPVKAQPNADSQPDPDDVAGFVLHDSGGSSLGAVFAYNTSGVFSFLPNMEYGKEYYLSRTVGNSLNGLPNPADPCFAVAAGQPVVFYEKPQPDAGQDTAVCGQKLTLRAAPGKFSGAWSVLSGPGTVSLSAAGERVCSVNATLPGTYQLGWTEVNGPCSTTDTVAVVLRPLPAFEQFEESCNPINTGYTISFQVMTGDAPFTVSGLAGSFVGSGFLSQEIPTEAPYLFYVADANGCQGPVTFGTHSCSCTTDAGTMQGSLPMVYCAGEPAAATWNNNPTLDADDAVEFILHDQPGNSAGNILARNTQPSFAYQPNFLPGIIYYISAIAGSQDAGGAINLSDKCLSVTPGVPVIWKALPQVDISGSATICLGDTVLLSLSSSGSFPLLLTYTDGAKLIELPLLNAQVVTLLLSPTATTTYQLIAVQDGTLPTCALPLMDAAVVTVNQPLHAGTAHAPLQLCVGDDFPFQLTNLLDAADFGGIWSDVSAPPALPGSLDPQAGTFYTAGQGVGLYRFRYTVTSAAPCPQDWEEVELRLNPLPGAEAGENKAINCDQLSATLEGSSTDPAAKFIWIHGADTVGFTPQVLVQDSGLYHLIVRSAVGCPATDTVRVLLANQLPMATFLTQGVRCFGDATGGIVVDAVLAGESPVLFALNGGGFGQQREFDRLPAGPYTVTLLDANGCEWTSDTLTVPQPPPVAPDLGPDVLVHLGDSVVLNAGLQVPFSSLKSLVWKPLLDSVAAGQPQQHFLPLQSWLIGVEVVDSAGCKGHDEVWVWVERDRRVFVPNIIAPSSSENGVAMIYGGDDVLRIEQFQIFDRWGSLVFSRSDFHPGDAASGWDGRVNGEAGAIGVYTWRAQVRFVDGEREVFFGDVTVVR